MVLVSQVKMIWMQTFLQNKLFIFSEITLRDDTVESGENIFSTIHHSNIFSQCNVQLIIFYLIILYLIRYILSDIFFIIYCNIYFNYVIYIHTYVFLCILNNTS